MSAVGGTGAVSSDQNLMGQPRPFGSADNPIPSPDDRYALLKQGAAAVKPFISSTAMQYPSSRQRTQGEIINVGLALQNLGNPFSTRRVPFSILRDMLTDPMIGFAYYYTKIPLMRADWRINCADPQIAQGIDEMLRAVNPRMQNQICGKLGFGYQPMVKRFKLGQLQTTYRDKRKADPDQDLPVWNNATPALLPEEPFVLAPEHCMPLWNDEGEFDGFTYSIVPLPNPVQLGITELYGYQTIPGYRIPREFAMWPVNEKDENFGSIYGSPRTKRAYRYWWSYWYRWALADRIFESSADPVKIVYYPTEVAEGFDPNDPDPTSPTAQSLQARALALGSQARQGATIAMPGDVMTDASGRASTMRKWAIDYLENKADFSALDQTFTMLDGLKFRAMFLPEEAFVQPGQGQRSARNVATQLGELYQESTVILADENDDEINKHVIPQLIAANWPDRAGIACTKESQGFGQQDEDTVRQIIQIMGQVKGEVLPIDLRELLKSQGYPLLSEQQQAVQEAQIAKEAQAMQPPMGPPEKVGMQGYNSGIGQTPQGKNFYYAGPERLDFSTAAGMQGFLSELPRIPPYKDASMRSSMIKLRKFALDYYQEQCDSFVSHLKERTTLRLADASAPPPQPNQRKQPQKSQGLDSNHAAGVAASVVGAWVGVQLSETMTKDLQDLLYGIAFRAGKRELKEANLDQTAVDPFALQSWASRRTQIVLKSIGSTLRGEMKTFLTNELQKGTDPDAVAAAAEKRFDDTPVTHADRVVLAESLPAYNYGQLSALQGAGVSQVQAHDASDGQDETTDAECRMRDGEVMSVPAALAEASEEHPAGTLFFTALSTDNLQILVVDKLPIEDQSMLAHYDADHEQLLILDDATREQGQEFSLAVGSVLALR